ncbi:MAG TPA: SMC-Scp complex subunit ScpB [Lacipirellulaceae bacterium]
MHKLTDQLRRIPAVGRLPLNSGIKSVRKWADLPYRHAVWVWTERKAKVRPAAAQQLGRRSRLEAVLFLSREPLTPRKLAQLANLTDGTEARTLLGSLRKRYDERGCAFQVVQVAGGYQLLSRPEFATWLRARAGQAPSIRLSPPALETLAVVAYRQPVLRAEVEAIRGVACGEILRQLMDRDLLRIVGRSEELGRPLWYGTTKRFLQEFGLCNLDELPWAQQLRRAPDGPLSAAEPPSGEEVAHAA